MKLKLKSKIDGTYFPQLHLHTGVGSIGDAFGTPIEWTAAIEKRGINKIAVTDHGNLAGIPWMKSALKEVGCDLIVGMEGYVILEEDYTDKDGKIIHPPYRHIVLLAMNEKGFENIVKLNNISWREHKFRGRGRFTVDELFEYNEGLIVSSACMGGIFAKEYTDYHNSKIDSTTRDNKKQVRSRELSEIDKDVDKLVKKFKYVFGDRLYIELMINHYYGQKPINEKMVRLIEKFNIEPLITNDCHYPEAKNYKDREVIREFRYQSSTSNISRDNDQDNENKNVEIPDLYLRSVEEIVMAYRDIGFNDCIPAKLLQRGFKNTFKVADRCKFEMNTSLKLPEFDVKSHKEYSIIMNGKNKFCHSLNKDNWWKEALFQHLIVKGYEKELKKKWNNDHWWALIDSSKAKLGGVFDLTNVCPYMKRVYEEYKVISDAGFIDYFLIVDDVIRYCEIEKKRLYGKGRGSVAGSAISWFLGITRDDPIKYGLYFERFMNPGRVKNELPDIDLDFASGIRDDIKDYIANKYGRDYVTNIGSVGVIKIKSAIQKVSAAYKYIIDGEQYDFHSIQKITHSIPQSIGGGVQIETLDDAVNLLQDNEENLFTIFYNKHKKWIKKRVVPFIMHPISYGEHAAGLIITNKEIDKCIPIRVEKDGTVVSQWRDKDLLSSGFLKLDILGLNTLDQIEFAKKLIKKRYSIDVPDINKIDLNDPKLYETIAEGSTDGVFQLNSALFKAFFRELKPTKYEHIYSATAILRPGPLSVGAHKKYIQLEHGEIEPEYLHPKMKKALKRTRGLIIFQEDVMRLFVDLAGFDLVEADVARGIIGKKKRDKIPALMDKFINGCVNNGIKEKIAKEIADMLIGWGSYGFNKSICLGEPINTYTADGDRLLTKQIGDVQIGEYIKSRDEKTRENIIVEVINKYYHEAELFEFQLDDGKSVKCSMDHKYRVKDGRILPMWQIIQEDLDIETCS